MARKFSIFLFQLSILIFLTSCYSFFQDKVAKDEKSPGTNLADLVSEKVVITKLDAPKEINVSRYYSPNTIFITWSEVSQAVSYRIERAIVKTKDSNGKFATPDDADFEVLNKSVYGTSYTDKILSTSNYLSPEYSYGYIYRVSAENPRKKYEESDFTTSEAGTLFAPVTQIAATQGEDPSYIKITWGKTENASSYQIYRSTYSDGSGASLLAVVTGNQTWYKNELDTEAQGKDFYYSIYALNSSGYTAPISPVALGYSLVEGAPGRVMNVRVTKGRGETTNEISIAWDTVAGADIKYAVYRTSSVDSAATLLTSKDPTSTTLEDKKGLAQNVYYYYQVMAYTTDDEGNRCKGPISQSSSSDKSPAEGYILSAPYSLSVVKDDSGNCILTFPAALGSVYCPKDSGLSSLYNDNFYSYKIYTCETQSGTFTASGAPLELSEEPPAGYYSVTVPSAKFFKVSTYRSDIDLESAQSMVAAPAPYAATDVEATNHAFIKYVTEKSPAIPDELKEKLEGKTGANDNGVYPVKITWKEPKDGADGGYYVYRSTKSDSGFRKVQDSPITDLEYIDSYDAAKPGTIYYYRVLSLNSLGQGVNYSDVDSGWGALTYDQYMREYNKTIKKSHTKFTLMHKPSTSALGSESIRGDVSGSADYEASMAGLGARIIMEYKNYADFYIGNNSELGVYFKCTGFTNTSANMSANGSMDGTVKCEGMYPGSVKYDNIEIKGGGAGGGYYVISPAGFENGNVNWIVGEE